MECSSQNLQFVDLNTGGGGCKKLLILINIGPQTKKLSNSIKLKDQYQKLGAGYIYGPQPWPATMETIKYRNIVVLFINTMEILC